MVSESNQKHSLLYTKYKILYTKYSMAKEPSLFFVAKKELLSPISFIPTLLVAFLYTLIPLFFLNFSLTTNTLSGSFALGYKLSLFWSLFLGVFTAFSPVDTAILLLNALLVGINIVLIAKTIYYLEHAGKVKLSLGGAGLLGLVTTGCSSCGFSLLSLVGLGGALSFLPFHGMEIHILALLALVGSAFYMLKQLRNGLYCKK